MLRSRAAILLGIVALAGCLSPASANDETCRAGSGVHLFFHAHLDEDALLGAYAADGWTAHVVDDEEGRRVEATKGWNETVVLLSSLWQGENSTGAPFASFAIELVSEGPRAQVVAPDADALVAKLVARVKELGGKPEAEQVGPVGGVTCGARLTRA